MKCEECGVTLSLKEERQWGYCAQCENEPVNIVFTKGFIRSMNKKLVDAGYDKLETEDDISAYFELLVMNDLGNF